MAADWTGVFAIPVTPFKPDLSVDEASLVREVRFCLEAGVHGLAYPAVVSEFFTLDLEERRRLLDIVVTEVDGQVPVIAGVSSPSSPYSAKLAKHAATLGVSGVLTMLPFVHHFFSPDAAYAVRHLKMVAEAELPIMFQNARIGYPLPIAQLPGIVEAVPLVRAVKEETAPSTHQLGRAIDALKGHDVQVLGGVGGIYLIDELARGAAGTMPAPPFADLLVDVFEQAQGGDTTGARQLLGRAGQAFTYELIYNVGFIKDVLVRRGVIDHAVCRVPTPVMDAVDTREIDALLADLDPLLRVRGAARA